jgi:hypothetical protein
VTQTELVKSLWTEERVAKFVDGRLLSVIHHVFDWTDVAEAHKVGYAKCTDITYCVPELYGVAIVSRVLRVSSTKMRYSQSEGSRSSPFPKRRASSLLIVHDLSGPCDGLSPCASRQSLLPCFSFPQVMESNANSGKILLRVDPSIE